MTSDQVVTQLPVVSLYLNKFEVCSSTKKNKKKTRTTTRKKIFFFQHDLTSWFIRF